MFPKHIFKAYDIRGLAQGELSEDLAYSLGLAFVGFLRERGEDLKNKKVVVGRDMRPTSLPFSTALMRGLNDAGANVVDIGLVSTPLFNFACAHYDNHAGGIMVTASHNPGEYNGFKMTMSDGLPVGKDSGMGKIAELTEKYYNTPIAQKLSGIIESFNPLEDYIGKVFSLVDPGLIKPAKIVVDAGNGMAKATLPEVINRLPIKVEYLYLEPDGNFPNHEANPLKIETLRELQKKVKETGADFGFALDGDADRLGLVDENGEIVEASFVGALGGLEVLRWHPGALMLYDLRSSMVVPEVWAEAGASVDECRVGHALIKKQMRDTGAVFGSELSLHLYFGDMYRCESPDLALMIFLSLLARTSKKMSELCMPLKKYFHSGEINFKVADKDKILAELHARYSDARVSKIDGLKFSYSDWWFNVRASNTEPLLRLNLEANSQDLMTEKLAEVQKIIES